MGWLRLEHGTRLVLSGLVGVGLLAAVGCGSTYPLDIFPQGYTVEPGAGSHASGTSGRAGTGAPAAGRISPPRAGSGAIGTAGAIAPPDPRRDLDRDGFASPADCNDFDASIYPGAPESCCDGIDSNCVPDARDPVEAACDCRPDNDGDGFNSASDCDDDNARVYPSSPWDRCCDAIDSDCDGQDSPLGMFCTCGSRLVDNDRDGYPSNVMGASWDCDDNDPSVHPDTKEICNDGRDNNCDFGVDWNDKACDDGRSNAPDRDGDGYTTLIDCNDSDRAVHPEAAEICGDGIDNDCDGVVDPCPSSIDNDRDMFPQGSDCNDWDATIFPGSTEYCCDSVDSNCDGSDNPAGVACDCSDLDGDGYPAGPAARSSPDCNDHSAAVYPGAPEICTDGIDNNCDGRIDSADARCNLR